MSLNALLILPRLKPSSLSALSKRRKKEISCRVPILLCVNSVQKIASHSPTGSGNTSDKGVIIINNGKVIIIHGIVIIINGK